MKDPYSILGVSKNASDEEIKNAYRNMARKYHPDNYDDANPLKELAKEKMQEINAAYDEIQRMRATSSSSSDTGSSYGYSSGGSGIYAEVRKKINTRRFREAEQLLFSVSEYDRTADWHFLSAMCLMQRGKVNDAMRELEIACSLDPSNLEYQRAKEMFNTSGNRYGSTYQGSAPRRDTSIDACDCCANLICLDCLCECMGSDLITCC